MNHRNYKTLFSLILILCLFSTPINAQELSKISPPTSSKPLYELLLEFSELHYLYYDPSAKEEFEAWVEDLKVQLSVQGGFRKFIRAWEKFIYSDKNIQYRADHNINLSYRETSDEEFSEIFLDGVMLNREGNRLGIAGLWASLAEVLKQPFFLVLAPRYPLILYESGGVRKLIDIGIRNRTYPIKYFARKAALSKAQVLDSPSYFRPLNTKEIEALYKHQLGFGFMNEGRFRDAELLLREAIDQFPSVSEFHSDLGLVLMKKGETSVAKAQFLKAIQFYPKEEEALKNLSEISWHEGDLLESEKYLETLLEVNPEDIQGIRKLIIIKLFRMGLIESEGYIQDILERYPEDPEALAYLATLQFLRGMKAKADENFELSLKRGGGDSRTLLAHGLRYLFLGIYADSAYVWRAMEYFRKAENENPRDWIIQYFIALVYFHADEFERARTLLKEILKDVPKSSDVMLTLAHTLIELGEYQNADSYIREVEQSVPDYEKLHFTKALLLFRKNQIDESIEEMKLALKQAPYLEKDKWKLRLAELYIEDKQYDLASKIIENILKRNPATYQGYHLQGRILYEQGKLREAKQKLMMAFQHISKNGEVLKLLAKVAYDEKDYVAAWRNIRSAGRKGVFDPEFMAQLREKSKEPEDRRIKREVIVD